MKILNKEIRNYGLNQIRNQVMVEVRARVLNSIFMQVRSKVWDKIGNNVLVPISHYIFNRSHL
jgi:hypothetical protein